MSFIVFVGLYLAFSKPVEAPIDERVTPITNEPMSLLLSSPAFEEGKSIPFKYTCDGDNINPELHISGVPEGTKSLVLVMDDPDIPDSVKASLGAESFDHWVLYNIPPDTTVIPERAEVGSEGLSSRKSSGYVGPCPPDGEHRYVFRLYAVKGMLNFINAPTLREVEEAAQGMSIESVTFTGRYERL
jgi:Raf kinase inhibitor-like YbhB/YbcL family protein